MNDQKNTAVVEPQSTSALPVLRIDAQALLLEAAKSGGSIEALERLIALAERLKAQNAKEHWLHAMAVFQETCPPILRSRTAQISTRTGGRYSYSYAPLAEILGKIQPVMGPLGLSIAFKVRHDKDQVGAICIVSHEGGHHEESGEVVMPIEMTSEGGTGANPAQRVGIASTYAKRYALLAIIGIAPEEDLDAKPENGKAGSTAGTPQRESASGSQSEPGPAGERNIWVGKIFNVKTKTGVTKTGKNAGQTWTKYILQTGDAQEFETFSDTFAAIARKAVGGKPVMIEWQADQYGKNVLSIEDAPVEADVRS